MDESRRRFLIGGAAALGVVGITGVATGAMPGSGRLKSLVGVGGLEVPDVPAGRVRLETRESSTRGTEVGYYTAVPDGHGAGRGLPVCLVLHGASYSTADFDRLGLARFLTDAVRRGAPPFVLAGVDGGDSFWRPPEGGGGDDPQALLLNELPGWLEADGFDTGRTAAFGWSMGGFGALLLDGAMPGRLRAVAALSPSVTTGRGDPAAADGRPRDVWARVGRLRGESVGLWCGTEDELHSQVAHFAGRISGRPAVAAWSEGGHTEEYWAGVTPDAFDFVAARLGG